MTPPGGDEALLAVARALDRHGVAYVLIGGQAARLHGATQPTEDVDLVPATDAENLDRLADALRSLGAKLRVEGLDYGVDLAFDGPWLGGMLSVAFVTDAGYLDVVVRPSGVGGHDQLADRAEDRVLSGVRVRVAALEDVVASKAAAGRAKDAQQLPALRLLLERKRSEPER